jgi:hypothetical protein
MGLLDGLLGSSGGGGLLDFLRANAMNQQFSSGLPSDQAQYGQPQMQATAPMQPRPALAQPIPLDTAQWPFGPIGAPSQEAGIPANAQPAQGQLPVQQPQQPTFGGDSYIDRLNAGGGLIRSLFGGGAKQQQQQQLFEAYKGAGLTPQQAYVAVLNPNLAGSFMGGGQTDDIKEYNFAKREDPSLTFEKFMNRKKATSGEYGLQGIWGSKDGRPALIQLGKSGEAVQSKLPDGFEPAKDPVKVDAGTHWVLLDPQTRQPIAQISKNVAAKEAEEKVGQAQGAAKAALPAAETTTTRALNMLKQVEEHPGLSEGVGFIVGRLPALTPKAADFRERIEQVDAMVFGDAVEVMRGLGALTDKEGPKVTAARARLKTAKSEDDFRTALKDVREVFETGIANMRQKAGAGSAAPSTAVPKRIRINADGTIAQ